MQSSGSDASTSRGSAHRASALGLSCVLCVACVGSKHDSGQPTEEEQAAEPARPVGGGVGERTDDEPRATEPEAVPVVTAAQPIDPQTVGAKESWGLCRLVAQDWRPGIGGTDLGFTIPAPPSSINPSQLTVLFGDTWARAHDVCWFPPEQADDLHATLPVERPASLLPGAPSGEAGLACGDLQITVDDMGRDLNWSPSRLFRSASEHTPEGQLETTFLRGPVTGFSDGTHSYGVFLRNEPATCDTADDCPTGARCSAGLGFFATPLGVCRGSDSEPDAVAAYCLRPSFCDDGTLCVRPRQGVCMAPEPFSLQQEGQTLSPNWYQEDPRRSLYSTISIASAFWPERPQDFAVGHRFVTNKFVNAVARTVAHFDPDAAEDNDYRQGTHTLLMWGRPGFFASGGAQAPLYLLYQPLEGLLDDEGRIAWEPRFFAGYDPSSGKPRWSHDEIDAQPIYGVEIGMVDGAPQPRLAEFDMVNHAAISWVEPLGRWVMFYGGSAPDWLRSDPATGEIPPIAHAQPVPNAIHMRSAAHPFGRARLDAPAQEDWTAPVPVVTREEMSFLDCAKPDENPDVGCTVPRDPLELVRELIDWASAAAPEDWLDVTQICLAGNLALSYLYQLEGSGTPHLYGTNIIDSWTQDVTEQLPDLEPGERAVEIYWNVSTWRPYQVVLMKTQLRGRPPQ